MQDDVLTYKLNDAASGYVVRAKRKNVTETVTVPETRRGLPVLKVGEEGFLNRIGLKNIVLPQSLRKIGARAFAWCCWLDNEVHIHAGVDEIADEAFSDCINLKTVKLENGLKTIGKDVFNGSNKIIRLDLPSSVTSIGIRAFSGCFSLKVINFDGKKKTFIKIYAGKTRKKPDKNCDYHYITIKCVDGALIIYPAEQKD